MIAMAFENRRGCSLKNIPASCNVIRTRFENHLVLVKADYAETTSVFNENHLCL